MKKINLLNKYNQEIAVSELINKHFWKSKIGPISSLSIPLFLMIIYKIISKNESEIFVSGLPSYFSFSILPLCFISLPQMIVEFKTSIILRKISISKITAFKFSLLVLAYNLLATIISTLLIIIFYAMFLNLDAPHYFSLINWGELIYVLLNIYLSALALGLFLGIMINKNNLVQIIGFCMIIIPITFSGQFIPITVLNRNNAIKYISIFSPISFSLNSLNVVLLPNNKDLIIQLYEHGYVPESNVSELINEVKNYNFKGIFDVKNTFKLFDYSTIETAEYGILLSKIKILSIYDPWQNILNLIMPYIISFIFIFTSIKKFKWVVR